MKLVGMKLGVCGRVELVPDMGETGFSVQCGQGFIQVNTAPYFYCEITDIIWELRWSLCVRCLFPQRMYVAKCEYVL